MSYSGAAMKILFVHQNFPGQYLHLVRQLASIPGNEVVFLTQRTDATLPGVKKIVYRPQRPITTDVHHYLCDIEAGVLNAQNVARIALELKKEGFIPDVMCAHNGWGESWYLKDVFPNVPLVGYFEFFYRRFGADVGFDPAEPSPFDDGPRLRSKNMGNLIGLDACDYGQCPTQWQKSLYPAPYHPKLHVVHEGIDTSLVRPDPLARLSIPGTGLLLEAGAEIVTYIGRSLEPYRGFPSFMRSLPAILAQRPNAQVVVVGADSTSYGPPRADRRSYLEHMLEEMGTSIDKTRIHFLGRVPYDAYLKILQVSRVHIYLTYPFVLSWSMLEAMAAGCTLVASRTAPVEEVVVDGVNGLLVDFFSPAEISERVIDVLAAPEAFVHLGQRARQHIVEHYDLRTVCLPQQLALLNMARESG